jgi:HK97 family phage major capsid protein
MDELEKLLKKFETLLAESRADVAGLKAAQETLQKTVAEKQTADDEQVAKMKEFQEAIEARLATIDELKALVMATQRDLDEVDPVYTGKDGLGRRNHFPNAKRARDFGLWIMASAEAGQLSERALAALDTHNKALAEAVNSTGGALVPEVFVPTLIRLQEEYGNFRRFARGVPMSSDRQIWPKLSGHVTVYYPGEGGTITASNPTFENVTLVAKKACALTAISSEVEEDAAVAIGEIVVTDFARGFAKAEDEIGFLGDGTSTYWGFTGIAGALRAVDATIGNIKSLQVASGNRYSEIVLPDFDAMVGNYPDYADNGDARWYMHRYFYWNVVRRCLLAYSSNIPTAGITPEDIAGGKRPTFLGYPVEFVNVMPKTQANSQICCLLANLNMGAYLGDRRAVRFDRSREVYFTTDQIGARATRRHGVDVFGVGDTTDPGPITGLITAAS